MLSYVKYLMFSSKGGKIDFVGNFIAESTVYFFVILNFIFINLTEIKIAIE